MKTPHGMLECSSCRVQHCKTCYLLRQVQGVNMFVEFQEELGTKSDRNLPIGVEPSGIDQHTAGAKLDLGKPMVGLVLGGFAKALMDVSEVGTFGATKYSPNGWKEVAKGEQRYMDAALRHLFADLGGELIDEESGCTHISQATWNLLAVAEFRKKSLETGDK